MKMILYLHDYLNTSVLRNKLFCLLILVFCCISFSCSEKKQYQYTEGAVYGTYYHVSYESSRDLQIEIRQEMEKVNISLSMFNSNSVIARLNSGASDSTDALFRRMFVAAGEVNRTTRGAFDITVGPLVNLWGFGFKDHAFPDSIQVDSVLPLVGMDKLSLDGEHLMKQIPGMVIDASSIAKGLGVDLVAEYLDVQGIRNYMVEIGGEVRVKGESSKKRAWRIGIDKPVDTSDVQDRELALTVGIHSGALATSGNYRNFYYHEGKKYAHTINPKTGYPVQLDILSSSIYAPTCMEADAYATAFMVIGLKAAQEIVTATPELEACFIYSENGEQKIWLSPGFQKIIIRESL